MRRRNARREDESIVIRMRHDHCADEPCAYAPACRPTELLPAVARLELNAARAREVLPKKMRRSGLDRFAILHHCFDAERLHRAGKALAL